MLPWSLFYANMSKYPFTFLTLSRAYNDLWIFFDSPQDENEVANGS